MAPKEKVKVVTGGEGAGITTEERKMYFLSGYHVERKGNGETVICNRRPRGFIKG